MERQKNTPVNSTKSTISHFCHRLRSTLHKTKVNLLTRFTKWIDPKLEKYRTPNTRRHTPLSAQNTPTNIQHTSIKNTEITEIKSSSKNHAFESPHYTSESENHAFVSQDRASDTKPYTPQTLTEFLDLMKRTPRSVLNYRERHVIVTIMNFPNVKVSEIMLPPSAITYVNDDEILGPLTLDRLYKSGYQHFPVIDGRHRIIGLVHTAALNSLEIKQTNHVREILDPKVYYLREDYTLNQALAAFLRTNCYFFIVVDRFERIVGMLTYQMIVDYLLGETPSDGFDRDSDRLAVAKRKV